MDYNKSDDKIYTDFCSYDLGNYPVEQVIWGTDYTKKTQAQELWEIEVSKVATQGEKKNVAFIDKWLL